MGFSAKQVKALRRNLDQRYVRTREANGRNRSGSRFMALASPHQSSHECRCNLVWRSLCSALAFIPMIQHGFRGSRAITAAANIH